MRLFGLLLLFVGCGSSPSAPDAAALDATPDAARMHVDDGTPMRRPCTNNFGTGVTQAFGRLDGILVAIIPPGNSPCNADSNHVHLQILANGAVYDAAVNVGSDTGVEDVTTASRELSLPGPAWAEGWHTGFGTSYISLGIHATDLTLQTAAQNTSAIQADLATANHISVFGTGYGPGGIHLVHHQTSQRDGMIVREPLSEPGIARLFAFDNQPF